MSALGSKVLRAIDAQGKRPFISKRQDVVARGQSLRGVGENVVLLRQRLRGLVWKPVHVATATVLDADAIPIAGGVEDAVDAVQPATGRLGSVKHKVARLTRADTECVGDGNGHCPVLLSPEGGTFAVGDTVYQRLLRRRGRALKQQLPSSHETRPGGMQGVEAE